MQVLGKWWRLPGGVGGSRAGFTLVEVLVTLVILSGGIVLVLRAFETSASALGESRDALRSVFLLHERMAAMEREGLRGTEGVCEAPFDRYHWRVEVLDRPASADVTPVVVHVWRDRGKRDDILGGVSASTYLRGHGDGR